MSRKRVRPKFVGWGLSGAIAGVTGGLLVLAVSGVAVAHRLGSRSDEDPGRLIAAAHVPPILTDGNGPVELRYDIDCVSPGPDPEGGTSCAAGGTVFIRAGDRGAFRALPLRLDARAEQGRYVLRVPNDIASSLGGFSYYAVLRNEQSGVEMTLPAGGAAAPQRGLPLGRAVSVNLGTHSFGHPTSADARVASAAWGSGNDDVGLEEGPPATPIGATAFDVDRSGVVLVLDEAHRRVLRFSGGSGSPDSIPLAVNGTLADMSISSKGDIHVLESTGGGPAEAPLIRSFSSDGHPEGSWHAAERTVAAIREGPAGPVTLDYPSSQWMPVATQGHALDAGAQSERGSSGRPVRGGGQVEVLRTGNEVLVALVAAGRVREAWRIESGTPVAEVQLAQPSGNRMVVVLRVYTDAKDEFVAFVLGRKGIVQQLSLDSADWAETAPLSRFRLVGASLYQLGSTPAGAFVDRFDLEVGE